MTVRLVIVGDQPLIRDGLRYQMESRGDFHIVGETDNSEEALRLAQELTPDLVVLDTGSREFELTRSLRKAHPSLAVLILTILDDDERILRAMRAGANGYVTKSSPVEQIIAAINVVASGGTYYSGAAMRVLSRESFCSPLSRREREVLAHVVIGHSNKATARLLNLSVRTIESHRETIRRKLGTKRMVDLIRRAVEMGLIDA